MLGRRSLLLTQVPAHAPPVEAEARSQTRMTGRRPPWCGLLLGIALNAKCNPTGTSSCAPWLGTFCRTPLSKLQLPGREFAAQISILC